MKLNITPKELLALYNTLNERFTDVNGGEIDLDNYKSTDPKLSDAVQLKQIHVRLRAIIIAGLTNPGKALDPIDSWLDHQDAKIEELVAKGAQKHLSSTKQVTQTDILADDSDEVKQSNPSYPKRRKHQHHQGKQRNHRK